jgi:hypothetical protein
MPPRVHHSQMPSAPTGRPLGQIPPPPERETEWRREGMDLPGLSPAASAPLLTTSVVVAGLCTYPPAVRASHRWRRPPWRKTGARRGGDGGGRVETTMEEDRGAARRRRSRPAPRSRPRTHPAVIFAQAELPAAATATSSRPRRSARAVCHRRYRVQPPWALDAHSLLPAPASRRFSRSASAPLWQEKLDARRRGVRDWRERIG